MTHHQGKTTEIAPYEFWPKFDIILSTQEKVWGMLSKTVVQGENRMITK